MIAVPRAASCDDRREEALDLRRSERGRRFVEQQDGRVAVEFAQKFDALLYADRQRFDERVGIDLQAVMLRDGNHAFARGRFVDAPPTMRLASEQDVLPHAQPSDQFEMLVNQADGSARARPCLRRVAVRRTQSRRASTCRRRSRRRARESRRDTDRDRRRRPRRRPETLCGCRAASAPVRRSLRAPPA